MRFSQAPPTLLSLLFTVLSHSNPASAGPYPRDSLHDLGFSFLMDRACASYCGAESQYCCTAGQACYTNAANVAYCAAETVAAATGWAVYTTTFTETDLILRTSTYSSYWGEQATTTVAVAPAATCTPNTSLGETGCGAICCTNSQTCAYWGKCQDVSGGGGVVVTTQWSYVPSATTTTPGSEYIRPTSGSLTTTTNTVRATTTEPFGTPASATSTGTGIAVSEGGGGGLSGGAIAGIVIGVIAGIILLALFCFCCVLKAGFDGLLAIFGLGSKKRRRSETRITEERYSRHGSGTASRRETHGGWFGGGNRPARVTDVRKKKSSGLGGLGAVGAGLVGLAVILGLKRKEDRKEKSTVVSDISSSYYTDSYTGTSASSASSDRRTRESRRH